MVIFVFFTVNYCNRGSEKFSWPNVVSFKFEIYKASKIYVLFCATVSIPFRFC
jgi:hypothetical protein